MTPSSHPRLRVGVGAVVVLVIVAVACAVLVSAFADRGSSAVVVPGGGIPSGGVVPGAGSSAGSADAGASVDGAPGVFVHVLGAVEHPGLYELRDGDRVVDAVAAAGGFTHDADQGGVNLARVVADGEQLVVPEKGAAGSGGGTAGSGGAAGDGSGSSGAAAGSDQLVNLNTADEATLETLPRIGPAMAQRILDYRDQNGGFRTVDDLKNVTGIGEKTFAALESLVTV